MALLINKTIRKYYYNIEFTTKLYMQLRNNN